MNLPKTISLFSFCMLFCSSCVMLDFGNSATTAAKPAEAESDSSKSETITPPSIKVPDAGAAKRSGALKSSAEAEYRSWLTSCTSEAVAKTVPQDQVWSKEAIAYVNAAVQTEIEAPGAASWETLANQAQALASKGCEDPLARLWIGEAIFKAGRPSAALPHFRKAAAKLQKWEYPKLELALASDRLAAATEDPLNQELSKAAMNLAASAMAEAAAETGSSTPPSQFAVYAGLMDLQSEKSNPKFWRSALATASLISNYPEPLLEIIKIKAAIEDAKISQAPDRQALLDAYKKAIALSGQLPEHPEPAAIALEVLALCPEAASQSDAKGLLEKAAAAQFDFEEAYQAYVDYLAITMSAQPEKLLAFGRLCLETGRFDTPIPRIYLSTLLKTAAAEAAFNWRAAFLTKGVAEDLETLYLGLINALPPDAKASRDELAMERSLLFAWCGNYEAAKDLFSKVPAEASILNAAFSSFRVPWKPRSIAEFESEIRGFTGVQKTMFQQWDEAMRKADLENAVKFASKLIAANASDKPLRNLIRIRTAWRLAGEPACKIPLSEETDPLTFGLKTKRPEVVKFLLDNGFELKRKGRESTAPLLLALSNGLPEETVRLLVAKGAEPDYKSPESGETPMTLAIERKMPSAAEFMAEMGSDPNAKIMESGQGPLHLACQGNMPGLAKILLKRGAKPNAQDAKGDTPLHFAVANGSVDCVQALVAKGADPAVKNSAGDTPLSIATKRGDEAILQLLKDAPPPRTSK